MNLTTAIHRQLFNVKALAAAGDVTTANLTEKIAIVDRVVGSLNYGKIVKPTSASDLPAKFSLEGIIGGVTYISFDDIVKTNIISRTAIPKRNQTVDIWKGTLKGNCSCLDSVLLNIVLTDAKLTSRDGLSWSHQDTIFEVSPNELREMCDCKGNFPAYDNNVITVALWDKINKSGSQFYEAEVWEEGGSIINDPVAQIVANKTVNTDNNKTNDKYFTLVVKGKVQDSGPYDDLDMDYVYPDGVKLQVGAVLNGIPITFENTQKLGFAVGRGSDMRKFEFDHSNLYTKRNYKNLVSAGYKNPDLVYQTENGKTYDAIEIQYTVDKVDRSSGDKSVLSALLVTEDPSVFAELKTIFGL